MKINHNHIIRILTLLAVFSFTFLSGCAQSLLTSQIEQDYLTASAEYINRLGTKLNQLGDFSLEDPSILKDLNKLNSAKQVVDGTVKADLELFESMKGKITELKDKYSKGLKLSEKLNLSYNAVIEDFSALKTLELTRGQKMIDYLNFVIKNNESIVISNGNVLIGSVDLKKQYDEIESDALYSQMNFDQEQNKILDKLDHDRNTLWQELAKIQN